MNSYSRLCKFAAALLSAILLSAGWLGLPGFTSLVGFVPLLWISAGQAATRRGWWGMFGWAILAFVAWNAMTIWWIWFATPVGPFAATLASTTLNMAAFMLFHTVSKKAPKALAYTLFVAAWITTEYWYTTSDFSWPWLILGNGYSHTPWAVQWYEYTGVFGGTLWTLVSNILLFEAWQRRSVRRIVTAGCAVVLPLLLSLGIWWGWSQPDQGAIEVSIIQPNVACYDKFNGDDAAQERNIISLLDQVPAGAQFILLPENSIPGGYWEPGLSYHYQLSEPGAFWQELTDSLRTDHPQALLVAGVTTFRHYVRGTQTQTARTTSSGEYYDVFNTALGLDSAQRTQIHHKGRLVIGVENTPTWVFKALKFLVIDLGGIVGQLGKGQTPVPFTHQGIKTGTAICYEGLYGQFYGEFVRGGAQAMFIISNDGWWGDTPGYKHLFTISRLRAIEHRRAIARSANTGQSGFISARGDDGQTLGWDQRGILSASVPLNTEMTLYTRYGDYIARISELLALLCVLYYVAYRYKRRNHLVP